MRAVTGREPSGARAERRRRRRWRARGGASERGRGARSMPAWNARTRYAAPAARRAAASWSVVEFRRLERRGRGTRRRVRTAEAPTTRSDESCTPMVSERRLLGALRAPQASGHYSNETVSEKIARDRAHKTRPEERAHNARATIGLTLDTEDRLRRHGAHHDRRRQLQGRPPPRGSPQAGSWRERREARAPRLLQRGARVDEDLQVSRQANRR